jgi:uncharacterized protein YdeI (YjbR/CyaY-like superfamily)
MSQRNPKVDGLLRQSGKWREELEALRAILLDTELTEEVKWYQACYTLEGKNVIIIHGFKEYCALLFFKGALMKDPKRILIQQTENVQAARQIRFTTLQQIVDMKSVLKAYVGNAIDVEKAGLKVKLKKTADYKVPEELHSKLDEDPRFKTAFEKLTPGRQRGYIFYFSQAKQSKTRAERIEKSTSKILKGKGLQDD